MRTIEDIKKDKQVLYIEPWTHGYSGEIQLAGQKKQYIFCMSVDYNELQGLDWEHVSVSQSGKCKTLPSWKDMCRLKDIFWEPDEEVHQIHPKAEQYVHGVGDLDNVLHLWRPVGGWGCFEE